MRYESEVALGINHRINQLQRSDGNHPTCCWFVSVKLDSVKLFCVSTGSAVNLVIYNTTQSFLLEQFAVSFHR